MYYSVFLYPASRSRMDKSGKMISLDLLEIVLVKEPKTCKQNTLVHTCIHLTNMYRVPCIHDGFLLSLRTDVPADCPHEVCHLQILDDSN